MANFSFPNGILNQNTQTQLPLSMGQPALANGVMPRQPALQAATGNARQSSRMPMIPNNKIVMGKEGLFRIGGAMMDGALDGRGFSAGIEEYGNIMDYNREQDMARYQEEEARRLEDQRRQDLMRKMSAANAKTKKGDAEAAAKALVSLQNAQDVLDGFDKRDGIVGWQSFFLRGWDQMTGDERENIRLKIESMKVDRVLANIAQTKGAISEKEMDIFMSDQPSWLAGEEIWRKWITDYMAAIRVMHTNLQNGTTVQNGASISTMSDSGDYTIEEVTPSGT